MTKAKAQVLFNNLSVTPHCYIIIKDDSVLRAATEVVKNPSRGQIARARMLHSAAGVNWVFSTFKYILESLLSENVLDVASFNLAVGENASRRKVNEVQPSLKRQQQQQQQPMTESQVTIAEHVKYSASVTKSKM